MMRRDVIPADVLGTRLVWCFDQCLKLEQLQVRQALKDVAAEYSFKFQCQKKSMDFLSWLEGRKESILLIADWREAKPIVEALNKRSNECDIRVCIVAQSEKVLRRATDWLNHQVTSFTLSFWPEAAEELLRRHKKSISFPRSLSPQPQDNKTCFPLSLPSLMKAVQDPKQAAVLEQVIRNTMWQTYED